MTDQELRQVVNELARQTREDQAKTARQLRETGRYIRELGRQIGGLGEKFGGFTEGMAFPSMRRLLQTQFGMDVIAPRVISRNNGHLMELDVLAYSRSGREEVYIVEVKSHLREDGLQQMLKILREFPAFFPEHAGKKVYGILAAVDVPEDIRKKVLQEGIYLARIHDETFEIEVPEGFQPRAF
jgi:hypothetical protein